MYLNNLNRTNVFFSHSTTAIATTESTTPSKQTQISPNQSFSTAAAVSPVKSKTIQALLANFDQNKGGLISESVLKLWSYPVPNHNPQLLKGSIVY